MRRETVFREYVRVSTEKKISDGKCDAGRIDLDFEPQSTRFVV